MNSKFLWIFGGLAVLFLLLMKKSTPTSIQLRGSNAVQSNNSLLAASLFTGSLSDLIDGISSYSGGPDNSAPVGFVGGGSPSILNVTPDPNYSFAGGGSPSILNVTPDTSTGDQSFWGNLV